MEGNFFETKILFVFCIKEVRQLPKYQINSCRRFSVLINASLNDCKTTVRTTLLSSFSFSLPYPTLVGPSEEPPYELIQSEPSTPLVPCSILHPSKLLSFYRFVPLVSIQRHVVDDDSESSLAPFPLNK